MDDNEITTALEVVTITNQLTKVTMLDPGYSYKPYLVHDEANEAHYRYDQSAPLRTYLELS